MADQFYFEDVSEGMEIPKLVKNPSTQQLVMWAAASGDFYQIHYDREFAANNKLPNIIVHGALKGAFLGQLVHNFAGEKGWVKMHGAQYRQMDYPNQNLTCRGIITKKYVENGENLVDLDIWTENPDGQKTSPGKATVRLPSRA